MQRHGNWCTWDYRPCSRKLDFRITTPGSCGSLFPGHFTSYFSATLNFIFYFIPWNGLFHFHILFHERVHFIFIFHSINNPFGFHISLHETVHSISLFHSLKHFISFSFFIPWNSSFQFHILFHETRDSSFHFHISFHETFHSIFIWANPQGLSHETTPELWSLCMS